MMDSSSELALPKKEGNASRQSSEGFESRMEVGIKFKPKTGRISRAEKSIPVQKSNMYQPEKTFAKLEHLRGHELCHDTPAYSCTFGECEKRFHRADLLARHIHRHEMQANEAYKSVDPRNWAPLELDITTQSSSSETKVVPSSFNSLTANSQYVNSYSTPNSTHETSENEAHKPDITSYLARLMTNQNNHTDATQPQSGLYFGLNNVQLKSYTGLSQLPISLKIPEVDWESDLSYTQSEPSWSLPASESSYSNPQDLRKSLAFDANTMIKSICPRVELDEYILSYWELFNEQFPIIHRASYNPEEELLSAAMAAIGTQYHYSPRARMKGVQLHEACRKGIDLCLHWSIHTMQAILLTEIFSLFRGRKIVVRTSRHFEMCWILGGFTRYRVQ